MNRLCILLASALMPLGTPLLANPSLPYAESAEASEIPVSAVSLVGCALPAPPDGTKVVAVGAYAGEAISSVAVGGRDRETNLIDVWIEAGPEPLYLVLSSYESMIWRVRGETGRVAQAVVTSQQPPPVAIVEPEDTSGIRIQYRVAPTPEFMPQAPASGVVGLDQAKVAFVNVGCVPYGFDKPANPSAEGTLSRLGRALGRDIDAWASRYEFSQVSLPSALTFEAGPAGTAPPPGFDARLWRDEVSRFWKGGLARTNVAEVVSALPAEPYQVLPSQMGLAQLVGEGAVEWLEGDTFRVVRPIARLPSSMGGSHSVTLLLAKGVSLPPGDPVHSCIMDEESGTLFINEQLCRTALRRLRR